MSHSIRAYLTKAHGASKSGFHLWKKHSRIRRMSRKQKIVLILVLLLVIMIGALHASVQRYNGYEILNCSKYVIFDMPEGDTVTKKEWKKIVKHASVREYPEAQYNREKEYISRQYKKRIHEYGLTYNEYLKQSDLTEDEFNKQIDKLAKNNVKEKLILHAIADAKDIKISSDEMKDAKAQLMKDRGVTSESEYKEQTGESLDEHAKEIDLESKLLYGKIVKS